MQSSSGRSAAPAPRRRRPVQEIRHLNPEARKLLLQAIPLVVAVRIALWLIPAHRIFRYAARWVEHAKQNPSRGRPTVHYVAWAVRVVSRRVPRASCLTQALAGQILMGKHGHVSEICVGVARDAKGTLIAHAWLDTGGQVLIGNQDLERYTRLPDLSAGVLQFGRSLR